MNTGTPIARMPAEVNMTQLEKRQEIMTGTAQEIADALGVARSHVAQIRTGDRHASPSLCAKISLRYGIPFEKAVLIFSSVTPEDEKALRKQGLLNSDKKCHSR